MYLFSLWLLTSPKLRQPWGTSPSKKVNNFTVGFLGHRAYLPRELWVAALIIINVKYYKYVCLILFCSDLGRKKFTKFRDILSGIFTCNIEKVHRIHNNIIKWSTQRDESYHQAFQKECLSRDIIAVKTIRWQLNSTKTLLEKYPNIKIVYYSRDPRGLISSQVDVTSKANTKEAKDADHNYVKRICKSKESDISVYSVLKVLYPSNYHWLHYEDLALKPQESVQELFTFLGIKTVPLSVVSWLQEATHAKKEDYEGPYGTKRNSTEIVNRWKSNLTKRTIEDIEQLCQNVLKQLNH